MRKAFVCENLHKPKKRDSPAIQYLMFVMLWPPSLIIGSLRYHKGDGGENVT